jgi:DNA-directed RNA polymerase specialized sigma24 family protein
MKKLSIKEASEILGISEQAVRKRISRGTLEAIKENGHIYVIIEDKEKKNDYEIFFNYFIEQLEKKDREIEKLRGELKEKEVKIDTLQNEVKEALRESSKLSQGVHLEAKKLIDTFFPMLKFPKKKKK